MRSLIIIFSIFLLAILTSCISYDKCTKKYPCRQSEPVIMNVPFHKAVPVPGFHSVVSFSNAEILQLMANAETYTQTDSNNVKMVIKGSHEGLKIVTERETIFVNIHDTVRVMLPPSECPPCAPFKPPEAWWWVIGGVIVLIIFYRLLR